MIVYRISRAVYAMDLSGAGARLFGGRWNHVDTPCLYASASRALAILEYSVNVNVIDIPRALSIASIEIPGNAIATVSVKDLPGDWRQLPAPSSAKDFGTALLKKAAALVIKIPSVVIPEEWNYLVNPLHPDIKNIAVTCITDYPYDLRIKQR
jgi:RES domain-containing protein